ncbi:MAG: FmdB family zinc ribbon protein [Verrucomicrobiaceae bacterium]|jgi:predicted nucleic acid-binding Zn ribbon protein
MPTYIYETLPQNEVEAPKRFEVRQSMNDKALTNHPDTGVPVRRVIVGGTGFSGAKSSSSSSAPSGGSCGTGCGCH